MANLRYGLVRIFALFVLWVLYIDLTALSAGSLQLLSTESDPDAFIQKSVNVINGDYCEVSTDLVITGPDNLVLQRFYSTKDVITGEQRGGWRIFPQRFVVVGKDPVRKSCPIGQERFEWTSAFIGARSGGIFALKGWRNTNGVTKDPLQLDIWNNATGMVNTYAEEINGKTNHQNTRLYCKNDTCELVLGDGTKQVYKQVAELPCLLLGEELTPLMASQIVDPQYFLLTQEVFPSGNRVFFSYDDAGHLISVEMKNQALTHTLSWMHFAYTFQEDACQVRIETSDMRQLTYHFAVDHGIYQLSRVDGSHCRPVSYEYNGELIKKTFPEGRFIEIDYQEGKVCALKGPHAQSGKIQVENTFSYGKGYTDVLNAMGLKTRYLYDKRAQLTAIQRYDDQNVLYRTEKKFWGATQSDAGRLFAKTIEDGSGCVHSYRFFQYDKFGNVIEERLYGHLTGKEDVVLHISPNGKLLHSDEEKDTPKECNVKTFGYSTDGLNLLTKIGDCKGNQTLYFYKPGTNLLVKKRIFDRGGIRKRTFQSYNEDAVCIKIIEDDGTREEDGAICGYCCGWTITERHIKNITPKVTLPGVGLPEIIEEKAFDYNQNQEIRIKKCINTYDERSNLLSSSIYGEQDEDVLTAEYTYNAYGEVISQRDAADRERLMTYDGIGNLISQATPQEHKLVTTTFDFRNQPIEITETAQEGSSTLYHSYDALGRKIYSTDRFGHSTHYAYDAFHRLNQVVYPSVLDEKQQIICPTFHYTYDIFGNVLTSKDPKGHITTKVYNLRGDPIKIQYPDGSLELFKYDTEGSLHRFLNREKILTIYEYDYLGRMASEESFSTCVEGISSSLTKKQYYYNGFRCTRKEENEYTEKYSFDPVGRIASLTRCYYDTKEPDSQKTEFFYDSLGRLNRKKIWFDRGPQDYSLECFERDLSGNIVEKRIEDAQGIELIKKYFNYDAQGHCTEEYFLEKGVKIPLLKTSYNASGEAVSYVDGSGQQTKIIIDYSHRNDLGQRVLKKTLVNPIGVQTEIEFDALSRVYSIVKKDVFGQLLSSQRTLYDPLGNKALEMHDKIINGEIIDTHKTQWIYGPMGRLEEQVEAMNSPLEKRTQYSYNTLGQLTSQKTSDMAMPIHYTYTNDGKLHQIKAKNAKKELETINTYSYDKRGNVKYAFIDCLRGTSIAKIYNTFDQVTEEIIKDGEGTYKMQYAYDRKGRLKKIVLPDESKIQYTYDAVFGRRVERLSAQDEILYAHTYNQYDTQGRLQQESALGYVGPKEYTYDLNGQKLSSTNTFFSEQYTRDLLGRLTAVKKEGGVDEEYAYNALSQLVLEKQASTQTHAYDSLDNRTQTDNNLLVHNALNQLTSYSNAAFSYDPQGNLSQKILDGEETHFENNNLSQLMFIDKPDDTQLQFSYDPFGRLLVAKHINLSAGTTKSTKPLSTSRYIYVGHQEIGSLNAAGQIETLKIPGLCGDQLSNTSIAFELKGEVLAPIHDIAGNVACLVDPQTQQVVESYQYTAFGNETLYNAYGEVETCSLVGNPWRFAEKRIDEQSGLILFGLRFYDPATGRWISQDPAGLIDGPNLYAYLHNSPFNHLDRFGLTTESNSQNKFNEWFYGDVERHCTCTTHRTCKRGGDIGSTVGSNLPKVTYLDSFESFYGDRVNNIVIENFYEASTNYDLSSEGLPELPSGLGIGFINGIWNDLNDARVSLQYVSNLAGGYNIRGVYNATHGRSVDLRECVFGMNYIATEPVRQLHKMWNGYFEKNSSDATFLMICHSQGAIHVRNALLDYPPELRNRISVVAIAPAAYIYQESCAKAIHYRARDFVPWFDRSGAARERGNIVDLDSHPDAGQVDHEFMSPTYREGLQEHIIEYIRSNGGKI